MAQTQGAKEAMKSGILIGSGRPVTLSDRQLCYVWHWIEEAYPDTGDGVWMCVCVCVEALQ